MSDCVSILYAKVFAVLNCGRVPSALVMICKYICLIITNFGN